MDLTDEEKVALWINTYLSLESAVKTDLPSLRERSATASEIFDASQNEKDRFEELLTISAEIQRLHAEIDGPLRWIEYNAKAAVINHSNYQILEMFSHFRGLADLIVHQRSSSTTAEKAKYFQPYRTALLNLASVESVTQIIAFLHEFKEEELAIIFSRFMLSYPAEEPPAFVAAGVVDWVTAHRVLLRLRHLALRLDKMASVALKEDREKPRWFHQPELSFLAQKVNSVLNNLLVNFKEYFTRAAPPACPKPEQPQPQAETETAPSSTEIKKEEGDQKEEIKTEPQNEGDKMDESKTHPDPAPSAEVKQEAAEATPMQVEEPPKQLIPTEDELRAELESRWSRRTDQFARKYPVPAHDLARLNNAVIQIYNFSQAAYLDEDITEDPTYMEPDQLVQAYFRNIILRFCNPKLVPVRGDGNCFFRAVIKSLWPSVTQFYEDLMSSRLRSLLNPSATSAPASVEPSQQQPVGEAAEQSATNEPSASAEAPSNAAPNDSEQPQLSSSDPYKGFIIPSVNDATTMATPGVWADHLQVKKASDYFERPLWLLRYDDVNLTFDPAERAFLPGPDYRISEPDNADAEPITLYFIPEMHYEVILHSKADLDRAKELDLDTALKECCKDGPGPQLFQLIESRKQEFMVSEDVMAFAEQICHVAFALDKTADLVEERFELSRSSTYDIRVMLQNDIQQISEKVKKSLLLIKSVASAIRTPRFVECLIDASPAGALLDHVLVSLSMDDIHIETVKRQEYVFRHVELREIRTGAGPLSAVFNRVQWCRSSAPSYNASVQGMRENKQRQEQVLRDTLRKTPSSGILGADPMSPQSEDLQLASSAMNTLGDVFKLGETKSFNIPLLSSGSTGPSPTAQSFAGSSSWTSHNNSGAVESSPKRRKVDIQEIMDRTELEPIVVKVSTPMLMVPLGKSSARYTPKIADFAGKGLCSASNWQELFGAANYWIVQDAVLHPEALKELFNAARNSDTVEGIHLEKCHLDAPCIEVLITHGNPLGSKIKIGLEMCKLSAPRSEQVKGLAPSIIFLSSCTWSVGPASAIASNTHNS